MTSSSNVGVGSVPKSSTIRFSHSNLDPRDSGVGLEVVRLGDYVTDVGCIGSLAELEV
jgi:hypothetical protein